MALKTASVSGLWSNTATWGGSPVPVNADTFVINAGVVVTMDVDATGFAAGFGASTINGTLNFSRIAGAYGFKMSATLTVSATGKLEDPANGLYPANCTFSIITTANITLITVAAGGIIGFQCTEPTHKWCKITQSEASGQAVLHIDTDLTGVGDALWAAGSLVRVDNINQAAQSEQYTIQSVTSSTITLTGNLSNTKAAGAYVILASRNIKIVGGATGTGISIAFVNAFGGFTIGAEVRSFATGINTGQYPGWTINGVVTGCSPAITNPSACTINAPMSGGSNFASSNCAATIFTSLISGFGNAVNSCSECTFLGTIFSGNTNAIVSALSCELVNATVSGNGNGLFGGVGNRVRNCSFTSNTTDINSTGSGQAFNTLFSGATENIVTTLTRAAWQYFESVDNDQVAGAYKVWCAGGTVVNVSSPVYDPTRSRSYQHAPTSATFPVFMQRTVLIPAFGALYVRCYVRKDVTMSYLPRLWLFSPEREPLITGSPNVEAIMTDSIDTWEVLEAVVANSTNAPVPYVVRTLAKNASGNAYFDPIVRVSAMFYPVAFEAGMAV